MTIAYLNVATDRQHLDIQREEISSFAAAKDIHVDKWVMEVSGEKAKQPGPKLKLVLERLKKGDALIVSDITRLCLTLYELMGILTRSRFILIGGRCRSLFKLFRLKSSQGSFLENP